MAKNDVLSANVEFRWPFFPSHESKHQSVFRLWCCMVIASLLPASALSWFVVVK